MRLQNSSFSLIAIFYALHASYCTFASSRQLDQSMPIRKLDQSMIIKELSARVLLCCGQDTYDLPILGPAQPDQTMSVHLMMVGNQKDSFTRRQIFWHMVLGSGRAQTDHVCRPDGDWEPERFIRRQIFWHMVLS